MWIGKVFDESKKLDARLNEKADEAAKNHERANTTLQDVLYSFNAAISKVKQTREVSFVIFIR